MRQTRPSCATPAGASRKFYVQGDTLYSLSSALEEICLKARSQVDPEIYQELDDLRESIRAYLVHYKAVLHKHGLPLPFNEIPPELR